VNAEKTMYIIKIKKGERETGIYGGRIFHTDLLNVNSDGRKKLLSENRVHLP
jgi:hypothetical protein